MSKHTLEHAVGPACNCHMTDITTCVICGAPLEKVREHVDTCGKRCFKKLLQIQRCF